jgi:hypothetical protein
MRNISDDDLAHLAADLEAEVHDLGSWFDAPRLYGLSSADVACVRSIPAARDRFWLQLAEGDPYDFLDRVSVDEVEFPTLALVAHGWAFPPDDPASWFGRPSEHPRRLRVRTVVVVVPDGRQCAAVRQRRDGDPVSLETDGQGGLLRALQRVWAEPNGGRAA